MKSEIGKLVIWFMGCAIALLATNALRADVGTSEPTLRIAFHRVIH